MKFEVTYYKGAKAVVQEVESNIFKPVIGKNGELTALFTDGHSSSPRESFAFSGVISVMKIEEGDDR